MENQIFRSVKKSIKYWYLLLILGVILILVGVWVFMTPLESYITLSILFAFTFLVTGIIEVIYAISNRHIADNWGWSLAGGIIDLIVGVLLVSKPGVSMIALPFFVGFAIMFRSIMAIGWSIELKRMGIVNWGYLLVIGILGLIFAFIMIWNPLFGGMTIVFYTALAFILIGAFQVYLSLKLRKLNKQID